MCASRPWTQRGESEQPVKLWHIAFASRLDAILRNGIIPEGTPRVVGPFVDYGDAICWAGKLQSAQSNDDGAPRLVVIVEFEGDADAWEAESDRPLDVPRSCVVLRNASVPPTAIRHVEVLVSALISRVAS